VDNERACTGHILVTRERTPSKCAPLQGGTMATVVEAHRPENAFAELLRRVEITSKARYHASRRLAAHELWSQWTLALLVVGHITLALILAMEMPTRVSSHVLHFSAVLVGVLTLTYSLLLGLGRFGVRAVMIHHCGLELGKLARELYPLKTNDPLKGDEYEKAKDQYYDCLEKYENHGKADYHIAFHEHYSGHTLAKSAGENRSGFLWRFLDVKSDLWIAFTAAWLIMVAQFSHYVVSIFAIWAWVVYVLLPTGQAG
jgi:hypothetical protein